MSYSPPTHSFLGLRYLEIATSPYFSEWLAEQQISLMFSSISDLYLVGARGNGALSVLNYAFDQCKSIAVRDSNRFNLVTRYQIWNLQNALLPKQLTPTGHDRLYLPQSALTTGNLNIHDMAFDGVGELVFVNTYFNCLARTSDRLNFVPIWQPPFFSQRHKITEGDCCHLTGLAMRDGKPAFVTCASQSSTVNGWRDHRKTGGVVLDCVSNEVAVTGLSMPHSPRWQHDELWCLNAGKGELGICDVQRNQFTSVCLLPGLAQGLCFVGYYAVVGVAKARQAFNFDDLEIHDALGKQHLASRSGFCIVNTRTGQIEHWFYLEGKSAREVFDVAVLNEVLCPAAVSVEDDEILHNISVG